MAILFLVFSHLFFTVYAGELLILKSPPSLKFLGDDTVHQSLLPEIFSAALGFTTQQELDWNEIKITDPFAFAEALVVVCVNGVSHLGMLENIQRYELKNDEDELETWEKIKSRVIDRNPLENNNTLVNLDLDQIGAHNITMNYPDEQITKSYHFLKEIDGLIKAHQYITKSDGIPDLYWFKLKSLQKADLKGAHPTTQAAKNMLYKSILAMSDSFSDIYKDNILIVVLVGDADHERRTRSISEKINVLNVSYENKSNIYDPDFPVVFNIILWFTVGLIFSLLAVSVFIASMDPGRDSIIYRMTSNRMKKDS